MSDSEVDSSPNNSALHVLTTPELLKPIFQFLDNDSNASNARVCRQWSEIALDLLWRVVQDMYPILSILAPMEATDDGSFRFARKLRFSDWERFDRYRFRVKILSYQSNSSKTIHPSALEEVARSRTTMDIFPSMRILTWDGPLDLCIIFMHRGVQSLGITLPESQLYVDSFLEDVGARIENLTLLSLRLRFGISAIEPSIITLLFKLTNLRKLVLPHLCLTSGIASAASHNQKLESIQILRIEGFFGNWEDVIDFNPLLQEDAFQSLNKLDLCVPFPNAAAFLGKLGAPTNLTELVVISYSKSESSTGFVNLVAVIAKNLPSLTSLMLMSHIFPRELKAKPYREADRITFNHLQPLLQCSNMSILLISHHYPLDLQLVDIEKIAMAWPELRIINLNSQPFHMDHSDLTLDALLPFARHCPKLREISLFLDATNPELHYISDHLEYPRFRTPCSLSPGASMIGDEVSVASFLSQIFPVGSNVNKS